MNLPHLRQKDFLEHGSTLLKRVEEYERDGRSIKRQYQELQSRLVPQIQQLTREADEAAREFKRLYAEASLAYAREEKATAKALSLQGKDIQEQCESLNAEASSLRARLKALQEEYVSKFGEAKKLKAQAEEIMDSAKKARVTRVDLANSGIVDNETIEHFLDGLPQILLRKIREISYDENLSFSLLSGDKMLARGATEWDESGVARIRLGSPSFKRGASPQEVLEAALGHEIGHICYADFLDDAKKAEWFVLHEETSSEQFLTHDVFDNDEEDFSECFRFKLTNEDLLRRHSEEKHRFIDEVFDYLISQQKN